MLNVGLTGNVAAGKSTVSAMFSEWGATVIDADAIVRALQAPGQPLTRQIAEVFGERVLTNDGSLDRTWLRNRISTDPSARTTLNGIVHPAVQRRRVEEMALARDRGETIVINDIPLLFEVMDPQEFDVVVLVDATKATRTGRLMERGLDKQQAQALIATQLDPELKRSRSDYVIDNDGTLAELRANAAEVWEVLKKRAESHCAS